MNIQNKKAHFDYEIIEKSEAGIVLTGAETKSFYENRVTLAGSYVKVIDNELYLVNAKFTHPLVAEDRQNQTRKLLVHKKELLDWTNKVKTGKLAIIPFAMYNKGRFIKVEIGLSRSKKEYSKKDKRKTRDIKRDAERDYKTRLK